MNFSVTYDDSNLRKAISGLLQKEGRLKFSYKSEKSNNVLSGSGKKLWFMQESSGKWFLPAKWRLQPKTWSDFLATQQEYLKNRKANYGSAMSAQRKALNKKLESIINKFNGN